VKQRLKSDDLHPTGWRDSLASFGNGRNHPACHNVCRIHQAELSICTLPSGQHQEFLMLGPIATSWLAKRGSDAYFLPFLENDVSYYSLQKNDKIA